MELVAILSRTDPDRISIKIREEKVVNSYDLPNDSSISDSRATSSFDTDKIESFANNALVKIEREAVEPLLLAFYSNQKLTTIDATIRFRSGVVSSITLKTEIGGY
jgi:hypothetical protein